MGKPKYNKLNNHVYQAIPKDSLILDVGCSTGKLGEQIKKEKSPRKLIGLEVNNQAAIEAKRYYDKVLVVDIEKISKLPFKQKYFDCIVLADILEHLQRPDKLLKVLSKYLSSGGVLIVSVPNVAFIIVRILLFFGKFNYQEKGILDKSHLHFFTASTIKNLLIKTGYSIVSTRGYIITRPSLRFLNIILLMSYIVGVRLTLDASLLDKLHLWGIKKKLLTIY